MSTQFTRAEVIDLARAHFDYEWPEQLTSGVMFFMGERITKREFCNGE